jgi:hypothetical protein
MVEHHRGPTKGVVRGHAVSTEALVGGQIAVGLA